MTTARTGIPSVDYLAKLLKHGGKMIKANFNPPGIAIPKGLKSDGTEVTQADLSVSAYYAGRLNEDFPGIGTKDEEGGIINPGASVQVITDPLDGTAGFVSHVTASVTMAAVAVDGKLVLSGIYDPFNDWLFIAEEGSQSLIMTAEGIMPIRVAPRDNRKCVYICNWPKSPVKRMWKIAERLEQELGYDIRCFTSAGHMAACVAYGGYNAALFPGPVPTVHDTAPGDLLVRCAGPKGNGGITSDLRGNTLKYNGSPIEGHLFSNCPETHEEILGVIAQYI